MPNWCSNHVIVEGERDEVDRFLKMASQSVNGEETVFSFNNVVPIKDEDLDGLDWLQVHYDFWGTKWDVDCNDVTFFLGEV